MDGKPTNRVYLLPLEIKLKHSTVHLDDPCPFLAPNPGVAAIHEYATWASEASEDAEEEEEGEGLVKKVKERWEDSGMAPAAGIFPSRELRGREAARPRRALGLLPGFDPENKGHLPRAQDTGKSSALSHRRPTGHSSKSCRTAVPNLSASVERQWRGGEGKGVALCTPPTLVQMALRPPLTRPGSPRASTGPGLGTPAVEYEEDGLDGDTGALLPRRNRAECSLSPESPDNNRHLASDCMV